MGSAVRDRRADRRLGLTKVNEAAISGDRSPGAVGESGVRPASGPAAKPTGIPVAPSNGAPRRSPIGHPQAAGKVQSLSVEVVTDRRDLDRHRATWDRLLSRAPDGDVFQSHAWLTSWLDAFWSSRPFAFFFVWQGGDLRAIAPLVRDDSGRMCCGGSLALPVNSHGSCNILHDGDPERVLEAIIDHIRIDGAPVRLNLGYIRKDSMTVSALSRIGPDYGLWSVSRDKGAWPIVRRAGTWEDYLASRDPHVRHEMRRKEARAKRKSTVTFRVVTDERDLDDVMADLIKIEERSWKGPRGLSITAEEESRHFYAALTRRAARSGRLRIYLLYIDGAPVGHVYGLTSNGEYQALTTSYDQSFARVSPGALLFHEALRDVLADGYAVFDFLSGESRWKRELANDRRDYVNLCVFSQPSLTCTYRWARDGHVKPFCRQHLPVVVKAKNRLRSKSRSVSE